MELIEKLNAIEEIKLLKARYLRFVDTKDWDGIRGVFCEDAILDLRYSGQVTDRFEPLPQGEDPRVFRSRDAIMEFMQSRIGPKRTVHHGHCHEVEILSSHEARGIIALEDRIMEADGSKLVSQGWGHYHELYRHEGGAWHIASSRVTRLHIERPS